MDPLFPSVVTALALLVYFSTAVIVGKLRVKFHIMPPATTGPEAFNRAFRIQQNTMEYLVLFLPALWLFSWYVSVSWAGGIGMVWVLARIGYIAGYLKDARHRMPGFILSIAALASLLLGAVFGVGRALLS